MIKRGILQKRSLAQHGGEHPKTQRSRSRHLARSQKAKKELRTGQHRKEEREEREEEKEGEREVLEEGEEEKAGGQDEEQ